MRHAVAFVLILIALVLPAQSARLALAPPEEPDATVVLNFKGTYSRAAVGEMQKEAARILQSSGLRLGWTSNAEAAGRSFRGLVVFTFSGACMFQPAPPLYDELGPYASTTTTDGVVQPFGTVDCDHVARSARGAMAGDVDYARADFLIGRALGRVVAHELVHMLTHSGQHGTEGVQKPALTGRQLIETSLRLSREDSDRLRLELSR
jgi:hypothetical protein